MSTITRRYGSVLVAGAMMLVACTGGETATTGSTEEATTTTRSTEKATTTTGSTEKATTTTLETATTGTAGLIPPPVTADTEPEPDETAEAGLPSLDELFEAALALDVETPASETDRVLGRADLATATAIADFLSERGTDLTDIEIWVLPVVEAGWSLLVFEVTGEAEGILADTSGDDSTDEGTEALLDMPWFVEANIVEIVLILHLEDEEGPMTVTLSFAMDDLKDGLNLDLTEGESFPMQIDRGP